MTAAAPAPLSVDAAAPEVRRFLERFFGPDNDVAWDDVRLGRGATAQRLRPLLAPLLDAFSYGPTVLPRVRRAGADAAVVTWYGLARSEREFRKLADAVNAFVGPTWSDFAPARSRLNPADPVEAAVHEYTGGASFRFRADPRDPGASQRVREALVRMLEVERQRVRPTVPTAPRESDLLREFRMALAARNRPAAEQALRRIGDHAARTGAGARVSLLEIEMLDVCGRPAEILALPTLEVILAARRPFAVTEAVARAVYRGELSSFEEAGDAAGALEWFARDVAPRWPGLFADTLARSGSHEALKAVLLRTLVDAVPDGRLRAEVVARLNSFPGDVAWVAALVKAAEARAGQSQASELHEPAALATALSASPETIAPEAGQPSGTAAGTSTVVARPGSLGGPADDRSVADAQQAVLTGDFETARVLLHGVAPSEIVVRLLLECAFELGTLEAGAAAREAFDGLEPEARIRMSGSRMVRGLLDRIAVGLPAAAADPLLSVPTNFDLQSPPIEATPEPTPTPIPEPKPPVGPPPTGGVVSASREATHDAPPRNWLEWMERTALDPSWPAAPLFARRGASEWTVEPLAEDPEAARRLMSLLGGRLTEDAEKKLRDALPHLLESFRRDVDFPRREFVPLYECMRSLVLVTTEGGIDDLRVFSDLASVALELGLSGERYEALANDACSLWIQYGAPERLDWWLEFLDLLAAQPCPDVGSRDKVLVHASDALRRFARRVDPIQRELFRAIAGELGRADAFAEAARPAASEVPALASTTEARERMARSTVAIYTLTESAGRRAKVVLEALAPGIRVDVSSDHVATERLRDLARRADVFVMVTASSKHAATDCIERQRPALAPLLRPPGKGSASTIRAVLTHFGLSAN